MIFEICIDSVEEALAAQVAGAHRVELCDNLVEGGTTPSLGMIKTVRQRLSIDMNVIIRPRGGDFYFSENEFEVMRQDVLAAKEAGANGVVIGLLNPDGTVDEARTRALIELARPLSVTFHRAFDLARDPVEALETLVKLGVDRILTSGQKNTSYDGMECIARMVHLAGKRVIIMPGGGVDASNIAAIVQKTGVKEIHFAVMREVPSPMQYRNPGCFMGAPYQPNEYLRKVTDPAWISEVIQAV